MSYRNEMIQIAEQFKPSKNLLFSTLKNATVPSQPGRPPCSWAEFYFHYQSAMHATRAKVYSIPYLDLPELRKRKLQILIDDDGLKSGDTHHDQLARAFHKMDASVSLTDGRFRSFNTLIPALRPHTANFLKTVETLYFKSLGAWVLMELVSDDFMRNLAEGLRVFYPEITDEPYFKECFSLNLEHEHGQEALALSEIVLEHQPELKETFLGDAKSMAEALTLVWGELLEIYLEASRKI